MKSQAADRKFAKPERVALPKWVTRLKAQVVSYFQGVPQDFSWVPLDLSQHSPLAQKSYGRLAQTGFGEILTYGELARQIGHPGAARAVGTLLGKNPIPLIVPCHRVLAAGHKVGGFSAPGGVATKKRMLELEGISTL